MLTPEVIAANRGRIRDQFGRFLELADTPGDAISHGGARGFLVDNDEWLAPLHYVDFLRDIGVHFTVNRMLTAKTYRERLDAEESLSFLEFNYQLLQAYDFLHLYRTHGCTLQLGGADQWGNIIAGVELIRRMGLSSSGPAHGATFPLLTTAGGKKMGKTERGAVWLDGQQVSPTDYYQYWIACDDRDVHKLLLMFTDLDPAEAAQLCAVQGAALRTAKARLAFEATALCHGHAAAKQAQAAATQAFGGAEDWSAVPAVYLPAGPIKLVDLVTVPEIAAFASKRQARERITGGAVRIDGETCTDPLAEIVARTEGEALRLEAGKKLRRRVFLGGEPAA